MEMLNGFKDSKLSMNLINKIKNEKSEKIKDLIEVLTSDDVRTFIEEQYKGAVVPVF